MDITFKTPIKNLTRVGATTARRLKYLGLETAGDLLYWFPFRYEDYRRIVPIGQLVEGDSITVCGRLELIANKRSFRRRKMITEALVTDDTGSVRVIWWNQPFIAKNLKPGEMIFLSGKVKADMLGPQFVSPAYEKMTKTETAHTARLVPIYSITSGLTQKQLRFLITQIIDLTKRVEDWVPSNILEKYDLSPLGDALRGIHFPVDEHDLKQSTERLKFDELFLLQLKAELSRLARTKERAPKVAFKEKEIKEFVGELPFTLTKTQKVAAWEILKDLESGMPMNRLLSGDVGSGKTIVAAMAAYNTVLNGYQAVIMAPTEILARQHYDTLCKLLRDKIKIGLLTRSQAENFQFPTLPTGRQVSNFQSIPNSQFSKMKKRMLANIEKGLINIVVGTHALLSEKVEFKDVGLIVVDEQHRFGVEQRKAIKDKTADISAHYLSMTATPIPRSLALMIYGDLDVSVINELPPGRKPIISRLVEPRNREKAYEFIRGQVKQGRQVFVICPLIEQLATSKEQLANNIEIINYPLSASVGTEKKSVMSEYEKLAKKIFPDLRVGFLHGKLPARGGSAFGGKPSKESVMNDFKSGAIDILVSTSVIEVGVDIPNASVMMIEGADRFGLAQLHQFRGRVGRSVHQSYCLLFTDSDSVGVTDRLKFFETHRDGFKLAEKDLANRGPGEVYGTEQSGFANLRLAKLTDVEAIKKAREAAKEIAGEVKNYPQIMAKFAIWKKMTHLE
ncbi:MAG: ATP-dependent DNA helicase RecG [Patescibacteria group bacterium]|nr:ATP-dependent DNA helicase RecG [Patescibacteria group bacterium]